MAKLPVTSGPNLVRALEKAGFQVVRQRGSHVVLQKRLADRTITTVIPQHKELATGTLRSILRQAQVSPEELIRFLAVILGISSIIK